MPTVWIPALMRDLTGGRASVSVPGTTVGQALANLEALHPGVWDRLCQGDDLSPQIAVVVEGEESSMRMLHPLREDSEANFLPMLAGGMDDSSSPSACPP